MGPFAVAVGIASAGTHLERLLRGRGSPILPTPHSVLGPRHLARLVHRARAPPPPHRQRHRQRHCRFKTVTEPTGTSDSKESDEKNFYVKPPEAPTPIAIHGDPMVKYNGTGTHFWIPAGKLSPLLTWKSATGRTLELRGRTFERKETGNQWFEQLVVKRDGDVVLDVRVNHNALGAMHALRRAARPVPEPSVVYGAGAPMPGGGKVCDRV